MANESERLFLSDFLKQYNIPVPDNNTPDSLFAAHVKKSLAILKGIDKDKINNEADLQQDLGLSIFDCLFFLADLERKFGIANKLLVNNLLGKPSEEGLSHYKDDTTIGTDKWESRIAESLKIMKVRRCLLTSKVLWVLFNDSLYVK